MSIVTFSSCRCKCEKQHQSKRRLNRTGNSDPLWGGQTFDSCPSIELHTNAQGTYAPPNEWDIIEHIAGVLFLAFDILYTTTISITKVSIILFYRRIFDTPVFRKSTNAVGFFVLAWFTAVILVSVFSCVPVNGYWDHTVPATCIDSRAFYLGISIANILTNVIILAPPCEWSGTCKPHAVKKLH